MHRNYIDLADEPDAPCYCNACIGVGPKAWPGYTPEAQAYEQANQPMCHQGCGEYRDTCHKTCHLSAER